MRAVALTLTLFAGWWGIGLGVLSAVRADTRALRVALTAPALGLSTTLLAAFAASRAGLPLDDAGLPLAVALVLGAAAVLLLTRPRLPVSVVPVLTVCAAGLLLTGWPMIELGLTWLGNANDDMANYALVSQRLLHHGFWSPLDAAGLAEGRNYATTMLMYYATGVRPGAETLAAFTQELTGRAGYEVWMPLVLAFHLTGLCAVAALAMQLAHRWWAATLAAALLAVAPLATFGVVQQLAHQVGGLALGAALLALLMRPELHGEEGWRLRDALPVGILTAGIAALAIELVPTLAAAYACYLALLALRCELRLRAVLRLWTPALAVPLVALAGYLPEAIRFLWVLPRRGLSLDTGDAPLFGFMLVPGGLAGTTGLQALPAGPGAPGLDLSILVSVVLLLAAVGASALSAWRGGAAGIVVVVQSVLAATLYARRADLGLYKLAMYAQPFLAAAIAAWIGGLRRPAARVLAAAPLLPLAVAALSTQRVYVDRSRNPIDFRHASSGQIATFKRAVESAGSRPIVSATDNIFMLKLQAVAGSGQRVHFLSRDAFSHWLRTPGNLVDPGLRRSARRVLRSLPLRDRAFDLHAGAAGPRAKFVDDGAGSAALKRGDCTLVLPSGSQAVFNRRALPDGSPDLLVQPCGAARNTLVFTQSSLGQHYYLPEKRANVSYFQLEPDFFFPGRTFSGFGRRALFRVLGASPGVRLVLEVTKTLRHDGENRLPPGAVVGSRRQPLPLMGRGSARVLSPPLQPQVIAGQAYLLLDLGENGRLPRTSRSGIQGLYGKNVPLDPRYLTSYVRDVSLVDGAVRPPAALQHFPADLGNREVEYSGLYEDGWAGERAYAVLAGGPAAELVVEGAVYGAPRTLHLQVDGRPVARRALAEGPFSVRVPVARSSAPRRVELRFDAATRLPAPDLRPVAAQLSYLGFTPRGTG
jgi:hypothetical protein